MNDTLYHYIDPGFSHTQVGNYTLLLLLDAPAFSLAIMHEQKLMVWRKSAALTELTQPGEVQEVLNFTYRDVITGITSPYFTLVPQDLYSQEILTDVARLLDVKTTDTVFAQALDAANQIVFKIPEAESTAAARFHLQNVVFGAAGWLQAIAINNPSGYSLYLHLNEGRFDIAYFRHGKLHLYNSFEFTHEEELAYYTVFVSQQLKLDLSLVTIVLSGSIAPADKRYHDLLSTIFKAVELNNMVVAEFPGTLLSHQLLALTALPLCASLADA